MAICLQSYIFHVEPHPQFADFQQCVTFNKFPTEKHEFLYNAFNMTMLYVLPLTVVVICYSLILYQIWGKIRRRPSNSTVKVDAGCFHIILEVRTYTGKFSTCTTLFISFKKK